MSFNAILFDPVTKTSPRVSARVFGSSIEVTGHGDEALHVDPSRCELSAGGWDKAALQISWTTPEGAWALSSTDPAARAELARLPKFEAALQAAGRAKSGADRSGRLGMALLALVVLLPLLVILGVVAFRDEIVDIVLKRIPTSVDVEVGRMFEGSVTKSGEMVKDTAATRAVQEIVDRLKAATPDQGLDFRVHVQKSAEVNAFAAPGGLIVVYTGLIKEAGSAEEVAGVLAHEIAHATNRHSMRQLIYAGGILPLAGMLIGQPDAAAMFQNFGQLSELKFSRSQEEDADRTGFDTLVAAGISTEGMARFFDRLANTGGAAPPSFLSTHPSSADRAAAIRKRTEALQGPRPERLSIDWPAVQASIR